jgi:hypothetical protein
MRHIGSCFLLLGTFAGCGEIENFNEPRPDAGFHAPSPDASVPISPLTVREHSPADDASSVPATTVVSITFSRAIDPLRSSATISPAPLVAPQWQWSNSNTTLSATVSLAYATRFEVTVQGIDLAGVSLTGSTGFAFVTANQPDAVAPTVTATLPLEGATDVAQGTPITITFSEPMKQESVEQAISGVGNCAWTWNASSTEIRGVPAAPFAADQKIAVIVGTKAQDLAGNALAADHKLSFLTGPSPTLLSSAPISGATNVRETVELTLRFSEPMNRPSVEAAFTAKGYYGPLSASVSWSVDGNSDVARIALGTPGYGQTLSWQISRAATDVAGNPMVPVAGSYKIRDRTTVQIEATASLGGYVKESAITGFVFDTNVAWLLLGDDSSNKSTRGFLSFDLSGVFGAQGLEIESANLHIYQGLPSGGPIQDLGGAPIAESLSYGPVLTTTAFDLATDPLGPITLTSSYQTGWRIHDVRAKTLYDFGLRQARGNRSQYRIRFPNKTDLDGFTDEIPFAADNSAFTNFAIKPFVEVTYFHP